MHRGHAGAQLVEGLLGVGVRGRLLAGEARGGELRGVAGGLHLPRERELIGREAEPEEEVGVERLGLREGFGGLEPLVELAEHLLHLAERLVVHGAILLPATRTSRTRAAGKAPGPRWRS